MPLPKKLLASGPALRPSCGSDRSKDTVGECREYTELCVLTQFQPGEVERAHGQPVVIELRGVLKKSEVLPNGLPIFEQHLGQSIRKRGPQRYGVEYSVPGLKSTQQLQP